jgi:hypothetical protein
MSPSFDTLTEAMQHLKAKEFTAEFTLQNNCLQLDNTGIRLFPDDFEIVEVYRFEGNSDPADETVLYAIESKDKRKKGIVVAAYGMYSEAASEEMIKKFSIRHE